MPEVTKRKEKEQTMFYCTNTYSQVMSKQKTGINKKNYSTQWI